MSFQEYCVYYRRRRADGGAAPISCKFAVLKEIAQNKCGIFNSHHYCACLTSVNKVNLSILTILESFIGTIKACFAESAET
jgi:hypothetical protein